MNNLIKQDVPTISIFTNFLAKDDWEIIDKYCKQNKDNFEFVGYGSPVRWKEYSHSKNKNLKFKRSFLMTEEQYSLLIKGEIEEPYPNDTKHGDNYKMYMDIPTEGKIYETLTHMLEKTEKIILNTYGYKTFRESGPWLTHSSIGDHMKLHCDGTFIANRDASTDFSSVYYVNDDYEGGNFNMPIMGFNFKPLANSLVMWSNSGHEDMAHEVLPVTYGDRFVSQGFFSII